MSVKLIALVGRRDEPTDGVEDYCWWLGDALKQQGCTLDLIRVNWRQPQWQLALEKQAENWSGQWVLLQYTALAWSQRGFATRFLRILRLLRRKGARSVVVFHDALPYGGARWVDRIRRVCQLSIMRQAYGLSEQAISTIPLDRAFWLPKQPTKASFVPVGANLRPLPRSDRQLHSAQKYKTVAVYGVTGGSAAPREARDIGHAMRHAKGKLSNLRLTVFGRGSAEAEPYLRRELEGAGVEISVLGLLSPEQITSELNDADALLFVRGGISSRRGSALAGIACELPVVGYRSEESAFPVTEAGVLLVALDDRDALAEALTEVLSNDVVNAQLRARSRYMQEQFFSWEAISRSFLQLLNHGAAR
jgi:glycosyltransferase involved in cell wall biosynthesis